MDFVKVCLDEIGDNIEDNLRYNALASRLSQLEVDEFTKFMKSGETLDKVEVDHEAQLKEFLNG